MVATFLTSFDSNNNGENPYRSSAKRLNFQRLNKQTVEAQQILNLVESFHKLAELFKSPVPTDPYKCHAWTREIMKKYNNMDDILFLHQGKYVWYRKSKVRPIKIRYDEEYEIQEDGSILYDGVIYPKYSLVLPEDNFFSMGFWHHPCVLMWLNYVDSLRLYINAHVLEFISQGGKPGAIKRMCKINNDNIIHPPWALDPVFHENHKAALLTKELVRKEPPFFINFRDFKVAYNSYVGKKATNKSTSDFDHYIWPFSQDLDKPLYPIH
jgi:hypothetical protein